MFAQNWTNWSKWNRYYRYYRYYRQQKIPFFTLIWLFPRNQTIDNRSLRHPHSQTPRKKSRVSVRYNCDLLLWTIATASRAIWKNDSNVIVLPRDMHARCACWRRKKKEDKNTYQYRTRTVVKMIISPSGSCVINLRLFSYVTRCDRLSELYCACRCRVNRAISLLPLQ